MGTVRAVHGKRLARPIAERARLPQGREKAVIIGRSQKQRVRPLQRVRDRLHRGLRGNAPHVRLRNEDRLQPERFARVENALMRIRRHGNARRTRAAERKQHAIYAAGASVRQKKARVGAENARRVRLRQCNDARRIGQIVRIGKLRDVRARALMPGRMKGDVPLLRAQHLRDMTAHHAPVLSSYFSTR